jgi:hypothetical protein
MQISILHTKGRGLVKDPPRLNRSILCSNRQIQPLSLKKQGKADNHDPGHRIRFIAKRLWSRCGVLGTENEVESVQFICTVQRRQTVQKAMTQKIVTTITPATIGNQIISFKLT